MSFKNERFAFATASVAKQAAIQQSVEMSGFSGLLRLRLADAILSLFGSFRPS